jgi:hypothetical protein
MKKDEDQTFQQQYRREDRAEAYRARRDAQTPAERAEEQRKQRVANRSFRARMSPEERALAAKKAADYQRARRASETPEQRKERNSYNAWGNRVWRARKKAEKK